MPKRSLCIGLLFLALCFLASCVHAAPKTGLMEQDVGMYYVLTGQASAPKNATTMNAAIANANSANKTIYLAPGTWTLNANVTVPSTRRLLIPKGTSIVTTGFTLTVLSEYVCENVPCFSGTGTVIGHAPDGYIHVTHFGADPDDAGDDTAAIQAAIASIPGTTSSGSYFTNKGAGCLYFPLPKTIGGFYKISSTLDFTEKWNICVKAPAPYARNRQAADPDRIALFKWYGATNSNVLLFHNGQGADLENLSVDCRGIAGTRGMAWGADVTAVSSGKFISARNIEAFYCDIGLRFGDYAANGPDIAANDFTNIYVTHNVSAGIAQYSGNGVLNLHNVTAESNGYAPTVATPGGAAAALQVGENIYGTGGTIQITGYVGTGEGATKPTIGDIVGDSVWFMLYSGWSEPATPAIVSRGPSNLASVVSGWRHITGAMDDTTTPTSVIWGSNNTLVIDGFFFSHIQVDAGQSSLVIDHGVRFYTGAQHTLGVVPTFLGDAVLNQLAYAGFRTGESGGRLALGRPPRTDLGHTGFSGPRLEMTGRDRESLSAFCTVPTGDPTDVRCNTLAFQSGGTAGVGAWYFLGNAYFSNTVPGEIRAHKAGRVSLLRSQGGDPAAGQPNFVVKYDNAASAGDVVFNPGTVLLETGLSPVGTSTTPVVTVGPNHIAWASAPPSAGTWAVGDVVYNNAPASGNPSGWMCSVAGTPGTWKALANIP